MCTAKSKEEEIAAIMGLLSNKFLPIPVTPGDLFDRLTISWLKRLKIKDTVKRRQARDEAEVLEHYIWGGSNRQGSYELPFQDSLDGLYRTNNELWDIENEIRTLDKAVFPLKYEALEALSQDGNYIECIERYLSLARSVYVTNDMRSKYKAEIDKACGCDVEIKEYAQYDNPNAEENP